MEGKDASATAPKHLTPAQKQVLKRQQELEYWKRHSKQIRSRNLITGLTIGAFVVGLFSYTILSVRQERIMDKIDDEAKIFVMKGPRTGPTLSLSDAELKELQLCNVGKTVNVCLDV